MRIGIIGYSFSGKTSLFNSLTGGSSNSIRKETPL